LGVSPSVFDEFVFGGLIKKKSHVVGNPIDLSVTREAKERADIRDGYDVVFLGRLSEAKAPLEFVEVIGELSRRIKVSAAMIGDGELRDAVSEKISALGLSDTVKLLGFMDNPHGVLGASRALCMTSTWEGYGLVAAEALALGKPVVATRVGGIPTILGDIGYLCDGKDEICDRLFELLSDEELYREASHRALERAAELDNVGEYIDGLNRIYTEE
jgi:glycosyltransferase involved in cell wall biosynthesis